MLKSISLAMVPQSSAAPTAPPSPHLLDSLIAREAEMRALRCEDVARKYLRSFYRARQKAQRREAKIKSLVETQLKRLAFGNVTIYQILTHCQRSLAVCGLAPARLIDLWKRLRILQRRHGALVLAGKVVRKPWRLARQVPAFLIRSLRGWGSRLSTRSRSQPSTSDTPLVPPVLSQEDNALLVEMLNLIPRTFATARSPVDVLVPVYRGIRETLGCLRSVLLAPTDTPHDVIVINDSSPEPLLVDCLGKLADRGLITLVHNTTNLGFVQTVNRGLVLHSDRDVLLLNSDTEVFGDWLGRLQTAAYTDRDIGSVTPLSNNATLCSYPTFCEDNVIPEDTGGPAHLDQLCATLNTRQVVDIPTGVGFCMYIRRDCLDQVGLLDFEHFGKGYGEENDFCMRARARGWRHLLAADTFVYHLGGASFGAAKQAGINRALKVLQTLHPDYQAFIASHFLADPALPYRRRLDLARLAGPEPAILFIAHDMGGGTERHIHDIATRLEEEGVRAIVLRPLDSDHVRLERPAVPATPNLVFALREETWTLVRALQDLGVRHVHFHHSLHLPSAIIDLVRQLNLPYDWTVHDYFSICPRINLINDRNRYCGEPDAAGCNICLERDNIWKEGPADIASWRARHGYLLAGARKVFVPHHDVGDRLTRYFPHITFTERRHFETHTCARPVAAPYKPGQPLRVVAIGGIGLHKGFEVLVNCVRDARVRRLPIHYIVVGHSNNDAVLRKAGKVTITGTYRNDEVFDLLETLHCHCAFFPSIWPETWCYTLSIAFLARLFPIVFDLGAPAARVREVGLGHTLALTSDGKQINDALLRLTHRLAEPWPDLGHAFPTYSNLLADYYGLDLVPRPSSRDAA